MSSLSDLLNTAQGATPATKTSSVKAPVSSGSLGALLSSSTSVSDHQRNVQKGIATDAASQSKPSMIGDAIDVAKNVPGALGQVAKEAITHPINTVGAAEQGLLNLGPSIFNSISSLGKGVLSEIFGKDFVNKNGGFTLPMPGQSALKYPGANEDVSNVVRNTTTQVAGYELGSAAAKSLGAAGPVTRVLGNVIGGQAVSEAKTLKERAQQAAFDAAVGIVTEGAGKAFSKMTTPNLSRLIEESKTEPLPVEAKAPIAPDLAERPTSAAAPEATRVVESTRINPIEGTGEIKTRGLSQGVEEKAIEHGITESFGELPKYKTVSMADQAGKAAELLNKDYDLAKRIAAGDEIPPEGLFPESVYVAVEKRAIREGDVNTIRALATNSNLVGEATTMGQRIRTLAERNPESPVGAIQDVAQTREGVVKGRLKDTAKAKGETVNQIKSSIKKAATKQTWSEFVDSITC